MNTIRLGSSGPDVITWQGIIGVSPDGAFGPQTETATIAWQLAHGLTADGVVGPLTWAAAGKTNPSIKLPSLPSTSKVAVPAFPGFAKLSTSDQKAFVKAAQWIAPNESDAPKWLAAIVDFESDRSWSPSKRNPTSGATGLIQFLPSAWGKQVASTWPTTDALAAMSFSSQLEYVKRYFSEISRTQGKIHSLADMYLSVFSPKGVGQSLDMILYREGEPGYSQNSGLDYTGKGYITVGDAAGAPTSRLSSVASLSPILVPMGIGLGAIAVIGGIGGFLMYKYSRLKG